MEKNMTRNRLIALTLGAVFGTIVLSSVVGAVAGAILSFCIYEIGAMIDMMGKKW